ncbi:hypothetical protein [Streptomyces sp. 7N604]|uniref:hypothetical protein n=1 Tax=Streptomyces sp. 7N604 TaxID=3457415 RepID=UPI003FD3F999
MYEELGELKDWEFVGRRGGGVHNLIPAEVIGSVPAARRAAEQASQELGLNFMDDEAVLKMLRLRHLDELHMFRSGAVLGVPLALIGSGFGVYWGAYVQYWESGRNQLIYLVVAGTLLGTLLYFYVRSALAHWRDPSRQNVRARAREYRNVARIARAGGADVPPRYPYYGPYPFAANYHPAAKELELPENKGPA